MLVQFASFAAAQCSTERGRLGRYAGRLQRIILALVVLFTALVAAILQSDAPHEYRSRLSWIN